MPAYDYRCVNCGQQFDLFYKTYADYDAATPNCPHCGSTDLKRVIARIHVKQPSRDYTRMSSGEMLNVLESGDSRQVGEMFQQVGAGDPALGKQYHDTTQRLLDGDSIDRVERDLRADTPPPASKPAPPPDSGTGGTGSPGEA